MPCNHLDALPADAPALTPEGCQDCLAIGDPWVHLRRCLTCGRIGCCDSSRNKHATAHFRDSGHPVVQSFQPGETWRWCYLDQLIV